MSSYNKTVLTKTPVAPTTGIRLARFTSDSGFLKCGRAHV